MEETKQIVIDDSKAVRLRRPYDAFEAMRIPGGTLITGLIRYQDPPKRAHGSNGTPLMDANGNPHVVAGDIHFRPQCTFEVAGVYARGNVRHKDEPEEPETYMGLWLIKDGLTLEDVDLVERPKAEDEPGPTA